MGRKNRTPGLFKRGKVWHIDKRIGGRGVCKSTGESDFRKAESFLAKWNEEIRQATVYGQRPDRSFRQAATKYLNENGHLKRVRDAALHLQQLDPFIGHLPLRAVHMGTLQDFIAARRAKGIKTNSINLGLGVVRPILNLSAAEWLDEHGLTWLETAPRIKLLPVRDARKPHPLSWKEQHRLFRELPAHLAKMALFKADTGCREQ